MNPWRWLVALLLGLILAGCNRRGSAQNSSPAEAEVVAGLLAISDAEVGTTDIVDSLWTTPGEVKTLAERINMDHISVRYSVKGMASTPDDVSREVLAARDSFATVLHGAPEASRDRVFLEHELAIHSRYLPMLDAMSAKLPEGDLKNIVERLRQVEDLHIGNIQRVLADLPAK